MMRNIWTSGVKSLQKASMILTENKYKELQKLPHILFLPEMEVAWNYIDVGASNSYKWLQKVFILLNEWQGLGLIIEVYPFLETCIIERETFIMNFILLQ